MSGLAATILIPYPFSSTDSGRVTSLLKNLFDDVSETRKGRYWDFSVKGHAGNLSVAPINGNHPDYEDLLQDMDPLSTEMNEAFSISFGCSQEVDQIALSQLRRSLVELFDGHDCG